MAITVVFIGETTSPIVAPLKKQYTTYTARSGKQGRELAFAHQAQIIVLDAVSLKSTGERICRSLRRNCPTCRIIHLHPNTPPPNGKQNPADVVLGGVPAPRVLLNAIDMLLSHKPATTVRCGSFELDVQQRILYAHGKEVTLTPKQTSLIALFLHHPNETLERKWLMQQVWDTDYTGDTRTLNVHMRHVREAIEHDASQPQFIKTVRGVGYRFELPTTQKKPT